MKRAVRVILVAVSVIAALWLVRAVYLYRVWSIAFIWDELTPRPSFPACLLPQTAGTTAHGAFADIAFLKIPLTTAKREEDVRTFCLHQDDEGEIITADAMEGRGARLYAPFPTRRVSACSTDWTRNDPQTLQLDDLGPCYGTASWFDLSTVRNGKAIVHRRGKGIFKALDSERNLLYVAVYRKR